MEPPRPDRKVHTPEVLPPAPGGAGPGAPAPSSLAGHAAVGITKRRKFAALAVAIASDAASVFAEFAPPLQWAIDGATAVALFAILGFRWPLLPVLVMEAIPGLAAFPTWVLVVGVLASTTPTRAP